MCSGAPDYVSPPGEQVQAQCSLSFCLNPANAATAIADLATASAQIAHDAAAAAASLSADAAAALPDPTRGAIRAGTHSVAS